MAHSRGCWQEAPVPNQPDLSMGLHLGVRECRQKSLRLGRGKGGCELGLGGPGAASHAAELGGWRRLLGSLGSTPSSLPSSREETQRGAKASSLLLWAMASRRQPAGKGQILIGQRLSQSDAPGPRNSHVTLLWPMSSERKSDGG